MTLDGIARDIFTFIEFFLWWGSSICYAGSTMCCAGSAMCYAGSAMCYAMSSTTTNGYITTVVVVCLIEIASNSPQMAG